MRRPSAPTFGLLNVAKLTPPLTFSMLLICMMAWYVLALLLFFGFHTEAALLGLQLRLIATRALLNIPHSALDVSSALVNAWA
jgi:hypothetical protein